MKIDPTRLFLSMGATWAVASQTIFTIGAVYYVQRVGLDPLQLVLVGTALEVAYFSFEIPTGVVADVYSRRLSVWIGYLLIGASFIFEGSVPIFVAVLVAQVIRAIGHTFLSGALTAWLADEIGHENIGPVLLRNNQVVQVFGFVGIGLGVLLAQWSLQIPYWVGGSLLLLMALGLALFMPETGFKPTKSEGQSTLAAMGKTLQTSWRTLRFNGVVLMFFVAELFFGSFSEGFDRLWEAHFLENFTLPMIFSLDNVVWFGIFSAVARVLNIVLTEWLLRRVDMKNVRQMAWVLIVTNGLVVVGLIVFGLSPVLWLAIGAYWLITVMRGLGGPVMSAWLNRHIPSESRATVLSMMGQGNALGQMVGGPVVGWIGTVRSLRTAMVVSGVILTPVLGLFGRSLGDSKEGDSSG